jgi:hypothetical protein
MTYHFFCFQILKNFSVNLYEFDLTNRFLDFNGVTEDFAVYYPYVFATVGNVCEFAGVSLPSEKKFRANYVCGYDCVKFSTTYLNPEGEEYLKVGKTTYFKVDDFTIKADKNYRLIYQPFDLFRPGVFKHE